MATATYHRRKLYIPKEVEEKLALADGDQAEIRIVDSKSFVVNIKRTLGPEERVATRIAERPFSFTLNSALRRKD